MCTKTCRGIPNHKNVGKVSKHSRPCRSNGRICRKASSTGDTSVGHPINFHWQCLRTWLRSSKFMTRIRRTQTNPLNTIFMLPSDLYSKTHNCKPTDITVTMIGCFCRSVSGRKSKPLSTPAWPPYSQCQYV